MYMIYKDAAEYVKRMLSGTEAREIRLLDEGWRFHAGEAAGADRVDFDDSAWRNVMVPHDYSIEAGFSEENVANGYVQAGILWYRKQFSMSRKTANEKVYLMFDGVAFNSQVWINGRFMGVHPFPYSPFWYEISPFINYGENAFQMVSGYRSTRICVLTAISAVLLSHFFTTAVIPKFSICKG